MGAWLLALAMLATDEPITPVDGTEVPDDLAPDPRDDPAFKEPPDSSSHAPLIPIPSNLEAPKDPFRLVRSTARLHLNGRFGVSVGNVLLVPFVIPGPAGGGEFSGQLTFFDHFTAGVDVGASFGLATDRSDPAPLAGYRGRLRLGLLADADALVLAADLHAGLSSVALLPLPKVGVGASATFRLYRGEVFTWDIKSDGEFDLVIIAPAPGLGVSTGFTWRFGNDIGVDTGVRFGVEADAVVAVVVNTAGAAAFVDAFIGGRF